ncbi:MAG TPA: TIGR00269 family protein [Candidatus Nanoarchaeia archaeon]|nr:TIGR00269 family protein [Candidatus Nanoarchaeia archaeon]
MFVENAIQSPETVKDSDIVMESSGVRFTKEKFLRYFERKVRKTIRVHNLVGKEEHVLAGVSGGKDSTVLIYLLNKILKSRKISVEGLFIDVGIQNYSTINEKNITKFCTEQGITLHKTSYREIFGFSHCYLKDLLAAKNMEVNSCTTCGVLKRYVLNKKAKELKATKLATGHNLDDEAQAVTMNMFKNQMPLMARLGPMSGSSNQPGLIPRIKPLYFCSEDEVILYSKLMQFPVKYDVCPCSLEAYRRQVSNLLDDFEKQHKQTKYAIVNSLLTILPTLKKEFKGSVSSCTQCGEASSGELCGTCKLFNKIIN